MKRKKTNKPDGRCATCQKWDRWHIRLPNYKDQQKVINLYRKSGAKTKSDYLRARLLGESFKVITENSSNEKYMRELTNIISQVYKIGVLYDYFSGSVGAQVRKFFHHFVGSSKIEALAAFGILISLARHYDVSVYGGSIPVIMSVGSCNYRLTHLFA